MTKLLNFFFCKNITEELLLKKGFYQKETNIISKKNGWYIKEHPDGCGKYIGVNIKSSEIVIFSHEIMGSHYYRDDEIRHTQEFGSLSDFNKIYSVLSKKII